MPHHPSVGALVSLGFTVLEAEVYVFLLRESPATGYRVSQGIGKPMANTYKAIESLEHKGAILVEQGDKRLCRAVPAEELLKQLERRFDQHRQLASKSLASLTASADDDRVYHLRSRDQVDERCRQMLEKCEQIAVLDVFPKPLESMREAIEATAARGVRVLVKVYEPTEIVGAEVAVTSRGSTILRRWPGHWLNLVVDGREYMHALLTLDNLGVHQAVWNGSAYLSWVYHSALCCEAILSSVEQHLKNGADAAEIRDVIGAHRYLFKPEIRGYETLLDQISGSAPRSRPQKARS